MWTFILLTTALLGPRAYALPTASVASPTTAAASSVTAAATSSNPFSGVQLYANPHYSSEIYTSAIPSLTASLTSKASAAAEVGTFFWLDAVDKVPTMGTYLNNIKTKNAAGANPPIAGTFVVYDLPDRDCAALASNGEFSVDDGGVANYKAYIDKIHTQLVKYSDIKTILVYEPDSFGNLVTNLNVAKCAEAESAYYECFKYALTTLNLDNVSIYLDAGHAGWLGWAANLQPAATLFAQIYKNASSPAAVRGLATNVANYNAWSIDTCPSYTSGNENCDEKKYVTALAPLLEAAGFPAHFITDTGRNGAQPTAQTAWGDWCNVKSTGLGKRPTTATNSTLEDAFVWVKPPAESDGTSNSSSARYDAHCGYSDALTPAPEAGTWFQAYFEQLLENADASF
ncbi:MAG: hypothetical protein M1834_001108 [Cirrosporium novae-zelandiae]|nr:MAG: hypothetical protein M1834_001108 [Cirrosporium novae-zelandiae]